MTWDCIYIIMSQYDIAGPMCFSGDYVAKRVWLPEIQAGDFLVIHDKGGYITSMYSRYNSRCASAIYGFEYINCSNDDEDQGSTTITTAIASGSSRRRNDSSIQLTILKRPETVEEALSFWGLEELISI